MPHTDDHHADDLVIILHVLAVDADPTVRREMAAAIRDDRTLRLIAEAATGAEAIEAAARADVDLIVLGRLAMSDVPLAELLPALRAAAPYARLLLFGWPRSTPSTDADAVVPSPVIADLREALHSLS